MQLQQRTDSEWSSREGGIEDPVLSGGVTPIIQVLRLWFFGTDY